MAGDLVAIVDEPAQALAVREAPAERFRPADAPAT